MFEISEKDIQDVVLNNLIQGYPLIVKRIPAKEKKKYIITCMMIHYFDKNQIYSEKDIKMILEPMVKDHVMFRRNLIDYGLMERTKNGSSYWLKVNKNAYDMFDLKK